MSWRSQSQLLPSTSSAISVLIPIFGLTGAALSWGISILITNTAGWIWVGDLLDIRLVAPRVCLAGAVAAACFGIPAVASRTAVGDTWIGLGCAIVAGDVLYTTLAVSPVGMYLN